MKNTGNYTMQSDPWCNVTVQTTLDVGASELLQFNRF